MALRTRNSMMVKARTADRMHVLPTVVHVRDMELAYFHARQCDGMDVLQTLLEALDGDPRFQVLLQQLDNVRGIDDVIKTQGGTMHDLEMDGMKVQWLVQEHPHGLVNVLERSNMARTDCFKKVSRKLADVSRQLAAGEGEKDAGDRIGEDTGAEVQANAGAPAAADQDEEYIGGLYKPLPLRKLALVVWLYPPNVRIPATGDRIPANDACVRDFLPDAAA